MKRVLGAAAVLVLLAVGCGDDGDSSSDSASDDAAPAAPSTTSAPEECTAELAGGTVTFGEYLQPRGLDPANSSAAAGVYGGSEMAAIYDTLLRYDHETGEFVQHRCNRSSVDLEPMDGADIALVQRLIPIAKRLEQTASAGVAARDMAELKRLLTQIYGNLTAKRS